MCNELDPRLLDTIRAALPDAMAIYLFGSFARQRQTQHSDMDFAVLGADKYPATKIWDLGQKLAVITGRDVDLVDLRAADTVLRIQVIGKGQCLYQTDQPAVTVFADFVFSDYARLNEERQGILEDIAKRGSVYG